MLNVHALLGSSDFAHTAVGEDDGLRQKLSLYQVFLRLYEQNRSLLDEILTLENSAVSGEFIRSSTAHYVQGIVLDGQISLVTNLMKGATQKIFQAQNIWTIGRDRRKTIIPISDNRLSRCHAAITYCERDEAFYLIDFDSTNGSFINGEQIRHQHRLNDGDRIRLGSLSFTFFTCASIRQAHNVPEEVINQVSRHLKREKDLVQDKKAVPHQAHHHSINGDESLADDSSGHLPPGETLMFLRRIP